MRRLRWLILGKFCFNFKGVSVNDAMERIFSFKVIFFVWYFHRNIDLYDIVSGHQKIVVEVNF